jgi:hypothetical protein
MPGRSGLSEKLANQSITAMNGRDHAEPIGWYMVLLYLFSTMISGGCTAWHTDTADLAKNKRGLPPPRRHPGDVVLDISFVSITPTKAQTVLSAQAKADLETDHSSPVESSTDESPQSDPIDVWKWVDETVISPEDRYALRRNGIRLGKTRNTSDFAEQVQKVRTLPTESSEILEAVDVQSDLSHSARRVTFRIGKRYELPVRQVSNDPQVVLVTLGDQTIGQTLSQSQPLFAMRVTSADARTARLSMRPEIQHGAMRQTWVGNDAALRIENRRDAWVLDELETVVHLEKGDILVAGCRNPAFGLGKHLFTGTTAGGDNDEVLMIVRVVELPDPISVNTR